MASRDFLATCGVRDGRRLRVLTACECSGAVRRAFRDLGHDAWSCDLKPAEDASPFHIQGDAVEAAYRPGWDLLIAHPVCRYLANSGAKHLYLGMNKANGPNPKRWADMADGAGFFLKFWNAPVPMIAVENPIMVGHAKALIGVRQSQTVQPWMFGHMEVKATCLWLKGLPQLRETNNVRAETMALPYAERAKVHYASPGPDREAERSRTLTGLAEAMALQWGGDVGQAQQVAAQMVAQHAARYVEGALLALLPPGVPPSFRSVMWGRYEGAGRQRRVVAGLMMFDGRGATVEVWNKPPYILHRWVNLPGGNVYWTGSKWARDTETPQAASLKSREAI